MVLVAACLLAPTGASAAGWTPPVALTPNATAAPGNTIQVRDAQLVVNPSGAQALAWNVIEETSDGGACVKGEATTRLPGTNWAPPVAVGCNSQVEIGPSGRAIALWDESGEALGEQVLKGATADAGQSFGSAGVIHTIMDAEFQSRRVGISATGRVSLAWLEYRPIPGSAQYDLLSKTQNADGSWPAGAETLATGITATVDDFGYGLDLVVGPKGDVVVGHSLTVPGTGAKAVDAWTRPPAGPPWQKQRLLGPNAAYYLEFPVLAVDPQDRVTMLVGLQDGTIGGTPHQLRAYDRGADTTSWNATPQYIESAIPTAGDQPIAALALDSQGRAQTAYTYEPGTGSVTVRAATRASHGTAWVANNPPELGPSPCATGGAQVATPSVAFDPFDTANIAFTCGTSTYRFLRSAGSSVYTTADAPPGAVDPDLATDADGYVVATWIANGVVYTSVYDAVQPSIDSVTASANPVAGRPMTFDVTGSDHWGPVTWSVDFGDGQPAASGRIVSRAASGHARAVATSAVSHTYAAAGSYTATITVNDSAGNSVQRTQQVDVAAPAQVAPPAVLPAVPGLPPPVLGRTVNVQPIKLPVRIREVGSRRFVPLTAPKQVRVGSVIDASRGRVRITIANGRGGFDTADFYSGTFKVLQLARGTRFATMELFGGRFRGCPRAPKVRLAASKKRLVRKLWGNGRGAFRTKGRFSAASIRGTIWLTEDRCDATRTRVRQGAVSVRDFVKRKTVVVRAGRSYTAGPRRR